jgi:hypothetical protein
MHLSVPLLPSAFLATRRRPLSARRRQRGDPPNHASKQSPRQMALRQEQPIIASMFDKPPGDGGREVAPTAFWRSVLICPGVIEYPQRPSRSWVKRGLKTGPAGQRGFSAQAPARLLSADPRQSRNKIEMPVAAEQRQGVLPRQGRNLEVIPGYRDNSFVSRITANPQVRSGQTPPR